MEPREGDVANVDGKAYAYADKAPREHVVFDGLYLNTVKGYLARIRGLLRMPRADFPAFWQPAAWEAGWMPVSVSVSEETFSPPPSVDPTRLDLVLTNVGW